MLTSPSCSTLESIAHYVRSQAFSRAFQLASRVESTEKSTTEGAGMYIGGGLLALIIIILLLIWIF